MPPTDDPGIVEKITTALGATWVWVTLAVLVYAALAMLIARRAGYSHWLGALAVLVPVLGTLLVLLFALFKWPVAKQRDAAFDLLKKNGIPLPIKQVAPADPPAPNSKK
jgi:amino acid transporter